MTSSPTLSKVQIPTCSYPGRQLEIYNYFECGYVRTVLSMQFNDFLAENEHRKRTGEKYLALSVRKLICNNTVFDLVDNHLHYTLTIIN